MDIVDSHCHLNHRDFDDIKEIIERCKQANITTLQTICTSLNEFPMVLKIAESYERVFCSVGVHPLNLEGELCTCDQLVNYSKHEKVIGIGETGLDYYYSKDTVKKQQASFISHIHAAQITGLPLIIHARNADGDIVKMLQDEFKNKSFSAVIHCFTASKWLADACLEMGFYISASGIITFKNAADIRSTFMQIPENRILVETDSPYLAPVPYRGKRNEPAFTRKVVEFLANMKGVSIESMATQTTDNFFALFSKAYR